MNNRKEIYKQLAEAKTREQKYLWVRSLGDMKNRYILQILVNLLNNEEDIQLKSFIAEAIIKKAGRKTSQLVIMKSLKNTSWITRMKAVEILGELKNKRAVIPLIRILKVEPEAPVKEWAAISLGAIKDKRAIKPLIATLKTDPNWQVRMEAANALGKINDIQAKKVLIETYYKDDYRVAWAAASALAKLKDESSNRLLNELTVELLNILHSEKDVIKLSAAIKTLGEIGNKFIADIMKKKLIVSKQDIRLEINIALEKIARRYELYNTEELIKVT